MESKKSKLVDDIVKSLKKDQEIVLLTEERDDEDDELEDPNIDTLHIGLLPSTKDGKTIIIVGNCVYSEECDQYAFLSSDVHFFEDKKEAAESAVTDFVNFTNDTDKTFSKVTDKNVESIILE